jgi:hypothetical protein
MAKRASIKHKPREQLEILRLTKKEKTTLKKKPFKKEFSKNKEQRNRCLLTGG